MKLIAKIIENKQLSKEEYENVIYTELANLLQIRFIPLTGAVSKTFYGSCQNPILKVYVTLKHNAFKLHLEPDQYRRYKFKLCDNYGPFINLKNDETIANLIRNSENRINSKSFLEASVSIPIKIPSPQGVFKSVPQQIASESKNNDLQQQKQQVSPKVVMVKKVTSEKIMEDKQFTFQPINSQPTTNKKKPSKDVSDEKRSISDSPRNRKKLK